MFTNAREQPLPNVNPLRDSVEGQRDKGLVAGAVLRRVFEYARQKLVSNSAALVLGRYEEFR